MKRTSLFLTLLLAVGAGCDERKFEVTGGGGKRLSLSPPGPVSVAQGGTARFTVSITRDKFDGPVDLEFSRLPEGVTVEEGKRRLEKGVTESTFTVRADARAPLQSGHRAKITASGGGLTAGPLEFALSVTEKK